jgi:uncharacterized integral membrane protein (TIGR00697 family)
MAQNTPYFASTRILCICHIFLITLSNVLVQYPFEAFGYHTTWGAFTYPAIFILTDITVRLSSARIARKVIFCSMFPGLAISYAIAGYIETVSSSGLNNFLVVHTMPLRVAFACFVAYVAGQLLDILVFQRYRNNRSWWLAPALSTTVGNIIDTILFFAIAFYHSSNLFLNEHWMEIATIDIFFKITIGLLAFVPVYGYVLNLIGKRNYHAVRIPDSRN